MATSSSNSNREGLQQYPYPSHVNAASFVSIKLSSRANYVPWEKQIWSLIFSHDMIGFIDGSIRQPEENIDGSNTKYLEWKRSDVLVQGWIFGSLSEGVMETVVDKLPASEVWSKLRYKYGPAVRVRANKDRNKKEFDKYIPLRRAIQLGDWNQAQEFFNQDKDALTAKLNYRGHRALHLAVTNLKNIPILENLLNQINPELLPTLVDSFGLNLLQYAVFVNNSMAIHKLVEKNPRLLFNRYGASPLNYAIGLLDRTTCLYLVQKCKEHISLIKEGDQNPFNGRNARESLHSTIISGYIDVAFELLKDYPKLAGENHSQFGRILQSFAQKSDRYPSAKRYNFYQKFVYSRTFL